MSDRPDQPRRPPLRNRGTSENPANRFLPLVYEPDPDVPEEERPAPRTVFLRDASRSVISYNKSPDVPFEASLNPYRGCEHGCIYCYARPTHEYLGFSAGLDFETKIIVKEDAPALLRQELSAPKWKPQLLALSGVTDPYQPIEGKLRLTRRCLEVLAEFRNPVSIVTKNHLVMRDADVLAELARFGAAAVYISITTLRRELHKVLEPRTPHPERRLAAIRELAACGIPVGVLTAPLIPGLNDHEAPEIIQAAADAGATSAAYILLRLPFGVRELFERWLEDHFPDRKDKVLHRIESVRGGRRNETRFGKRMAGEGIFAEQIAALHRAAAKKAGIADRDWTLETRHFRRPGPRQLELFE